MVELEWKLHTGSISCASHLVEPPRSCIRTSKKVWPAPRTMEKKTLFGSQARWHFLFPFPYCDIWLERPHQLNCGYCNPKKQRTVPWKNMFHRERERYHIEITIRGPYRYPGQYHRTLNLQCMLKWRPSVWEQFVSLLGKEKYANPNPIPFLLQDFSQATFLPSASSWAIITHINLNQWRTTLVENLNSLGLPTEFNFNSKFRMPVLLHNSSSIYCLLFSFRFGNHVLSQYRQLRD